MMHRLTLPSGGSLDTLSLLDAAQGEALLSRLQREIAWESREIVLFGKRTVQPRLIAWCGERPYTYSGQTLDPRPVPQLVQELVERVSEEAGVGFNHVLLNRYRDGRDSMGFHADDERELGEDPTVASLSLGVARKLVFKSAREKHEPRTELVLDSGLLLVMRPPCQAAYRHALPKVADVRAERISLTFRRVLD